MAVGVESASILPQLPQQVYRFLGTEGIPEFVDIDLERFGLFELATTKSLYTR